MIPLSTGDSRSWRHNHIDQVPTSVQIYPFPATGRIDLRFEPEFERISENGTPDSYFVNRHQMFGRYLGRITPDNSGAVELHDLFGWIDDHQARR